MEQFAFWFYTITVLVSVASFVSALLLYPRYTTAYFGYYLLLLSTSIVFFLVYALAFFIQRYVPSPLTTYHIDLIILALCLSATMYAAPHFTLTLIGRKVKKRYSSIFLLVSIALFLAIVVPSIAGFIAGTETLTIRIIDIIMRLFYCAWFVMALMHARSIAADASKRPMLYFVAVSVLVLPFAIIEQILAHGRYAAFLYGAYLLLWNLGMLVYTVRVFYRPVPTDGGLTKHFIHLYGLTAREQEIIQALVKGKNSREIAKTFNVSKKTVDGHVYNIYRKCYIRNRVELMLLIKEKSLQR
ncbi:MAG: helix-turn-helix transcriptional regulator [Spirochaetes bacterium]|nr:helix-turn-helix transcriptional regulator [Spirochaetota bacterium]